MKHYEDRVVTAFMYCSVLWALLGMAAGVYVAAELVWPTIDGGWPALTFGRLRTAHTTLVLFGFGVSALIATAFYSVQRTSHVRLFAPGLAWAVFYAWQATIVLGAVSILAGWNAGKEYAELEWPFDLAITAAWVGFAVVFFGTIAKRKVEAIYISNWFYGALIIVVAMLHIVNSLALPVTLGKSYSLFAGAQDAVVQWWYGHNAVGFLLTGGFLGMLYYFLPKQAEQPIWSYRLSIVAFWAFVYTYIWAGPHHLHYTRDSGMAAVARHGHEPDPARAVLGDDGQRHHDGQRRGQEAEDRSGAEIHRAGARLLRPRDVRGADARDQERQRIQPLHRVDHRPRPFGSARLERADHVRHVLFHGAAHGGSAAAQRAAREHPFLAGPRRHDALRARDVGRGRVAGRAVAVAR